MGGCDLTFSSLFLLLVFASQIGQDRRKISFWVLSFDVFFLKKAVVKYFPSLKGTFVMTSYLFLLVSHC
jgi:hypothetical protein